MTQSFFCVVVCEERRDIRKWVAIPNGVVPFVDMQANFCAAITRGQFVVRALLQQWARWHAWKNIRDRVSNYPGNSMPGKCGPISSMRALAAAPNAGSH